MLFRSKLAWPLFNFLALEPHNIKLKPLFSIGQWTSPHWLTEKVFSVTFQFESKPTPIPKPRPTYRNPIYRAREYARMIETGQAKNESDLARKIGVSRVRVCQYVRLLSLDGFVIKALEQLGDPLTERVITERRLRPYLTKTPKEQQEIIKLIAKLKL